MRIKVFTSIFILCLGMLLISLFRIQIVMHEKYRVMSENNSLKVIPLPAPRGCIYDRRKNALAKDTLSFDVFVVYNRVKNTSLVADVLGDVLKISEEKIISIIKESRKKPFSPVYVAQGIGIEKAIHMEEIAADYPGLFLEPSVRREYVYEEVASNVLGYVGLINRAEFDKLKHYGYRVNDLVGRGGVEKFYDEYLKGTYGGRQIEVNYLGREETTLGFKEPIPGKDIYLTIDLELQRFCDGLLEDKRGGILAMNPDTGAIVTMASAPGYDPNVFVDQSKKGNINDILKDERYPLLNRTISGTYPPGSLFKAVTATAALETKRASSETIFECPGYFSLGKARFRCWRKPGHGAQTMTDAIKHSCNVYFFNLGLLLGVDKLSEFARRFGFGTPTGVDLPRERLGTVPTRHWKRKRFNDRWYKGDTVNYSIGQGYLLCSPIQIARMISVFANKGYLVKPYVVERIGSVLIGSSTKTNLNISQATLETVREGLRKVVNSPRGTGVGARLDDVVVAGKTGTAQTSKDKSHGWFMGFAPYEDAKLVVVVFDEYGGKGGYYAARTAGKVFQKAAELGML